MNDYKFNKILAEKLQEDKLRVDKFSRNDNFSREDLDKFMTNSITLAIKPDQKIENWKVEDPFKIKGDLEDHHFTFYTFIFMMEIIRTVVINGHQFNLLEPKKEYESDDVLKWCMGYNIRLFQILKLRK